MFRASVLFGMAFVYTFCVAKTKDWFPQPDVDDVPRKRASELAQLKKTAAKHMWTPCVERPAKL